jgi:hypothetical protein
LLKVAILDPEHLFEQADLLITARAGRPRQADIRRAISATYYGLFHAAVTAAADQVVGATNRAKSRYGLVYRSIDHKSLRDLCEAIKKPNLPDKYKPYAPQGGFEPDIIAFATAVAELQEKRHEADYNPMIQMKRSDTILWIGAARAALTGFQNVDPEQRTIFLTLLLFATRSR